jgi:hypothetical protein
MKAADVGLAESDLVLGKHSGRHALRARHPDGDGPAERPGWHAARRGGAG